MPTETKRKGSLSPDILRILDDAGFKKPTHLQELLLPSVVDGKDVIIESGSHRGKTLTMVIPMVMKFKHERHAIRGLVITQKIEQAQKCVKYAKRLQKEKSGSLAAASIGFSDLIKKESRQLEAHPAIVVSTPHRLIDHIRRNNIDLSKVEMVFIDEEEKRSEEFVNDIFFIFSKMEQNFQIIRYTYPGQEGYDPLASLIRRPLVIQNKEFEKNKTEAVSAYYIAEDRDTLLKHLLYSLNAEAPLVIVGSETEGNQLYKELKAALLKGFVVTSETTQEKLHRYFGLLGMQSIDFIIMTANQCKKIKGESVSHIIFHTIPASEEEYNAVCHPDITGFELKEIISVTDQKNEARLTEIVQRGKIHMEKRDNPQEQEVIFAAAKKMKEKMIDYIDQDEFKKTVAALKKAVPFGQRTLFATYLFYETAQKLLSHKTKHTTLFINVGKTRNVSPEDIRKHFCDILDVPGTRIKDIRLFDNYCFVEVDADLAQKAIEKVSNSEIRGKKVSVSLSRKKPERRNFGSRRNR